MSDRSKLLHNGSARTRSGLQVIVATLVETATPRSSTAPSRRYRDAPELAVSTSLSDGYLGDGWEIEHHLEAPGCRARPIAWPALNRATSPSPGESLTSQPQNAASRRDHHDLRSRCSNPQTREIKAEPGPRSCRTPMGNHHGRTAQHPSENIVAINPPGAPHSGRFNLLRARRKGAFCFDSPPQVFRAGFVAVASSIPASQPPTGKPTNDATTPGASTCMTPDRLDALGTTWHLKASARLSLLVELSRAVPMLGGQSTQAAIDNLWQSVDSCPLHVPNVVFKPGVRHVIVAPSPGTAGRCPLHSLPFNAAIDGFHVLGFVPRYSRRNFIRHAYYWASKATLICIPTGPGMEESMDDVTEHQVPPKAAAMRRKTALECARRLEAAATILRAPSATNECSDASASLEAKARAATGGQADRKMAEYAAYHDRHVLRTGCSVNAPCRTPWPCIRAGLFYAHAGQVPRGDGRHPAADQRRGRRRFAPHRRSAASRAGPAQRRRPLRASTPAHGCCARSATSHTQATRRPAGHQACTPVPTAAVERA